MKTPWGQSDSKEVLANGITFYGTPGHGGFWVPKRLLSRIPYAQQMKAMKSSGSARWYEEDCDWSIVALAFPEVFTADQVAQAKQTFERWIAPALAKLTAVPVTIPAPIVLAAV